jgi:single-strand DNA-binding protein
VVVGRITQREYQTKEGEKRTAWEVTADAIGPDLRFAQVTVTRAERSGAAYGAQNTEPWASTSPGTGFDAQTASWGSDSETPF